MGPQNGQYASSQYFLRQSIGMMAAHVAFTAAIGAGFGIARQLQDPAKRRLAILCGFATAIAGHFSNDVLMTYFGRVKENWFSPSSTMDMLVYTPLAFVLLQGPLVLLYLVLLRRGLRDQTAALAVELRAEAATGFGAVAPHEVAEVLMRPLRRLLLRLKALRSEGIAGWNALGRLHNTQLELGMARWHTTRGERDPNAPDDDNRATPTHSWAPDTGGSVSPRGRRPYRGHRQHEDSDSYSDPCPLSDSNPDRQALRHRRGEHVTAAFSPITAQAAAPCSSPSYDQSAASAGDPCASTSDEGTAIADVAAVAVPAVAAAAAWRKEPGRGGPGRGFGSGHPGGRLNSRTEDRYATVQ